MIAAITAILGFLSGTVPGILSFFTARENNAQQLKLAQLQMESNKQQVDGQIAVASAQSDALQQQSLYSLDSASSGNSRMDAFKGSVRPVITYIFFGMWLAVEITVLVYGIGRNVDLIQLCKAVWDENTQAIFAAVISFWFGNRMMEKFYKPQQLVSPIPLTLQKTLAPKK